MPKFNDHDCLLMQQEEDVIKQFIDSGIFISIRRTIRSWCMINRSHPETARYFKSNAARRQEEIRHLNRNYIMIHPFSMFNLYWEFGMFWLFTFQFVLIPLDVSFHIVDKEEKIPLVKFFAHFLQVFDIIKLFFTGYYSQEKSKVMLDHTSIAKRYLRTFFFIDVISSTYFYLFPFVIFKSLSDKIKPGVIVIRILNSLKITRVPRWLSILESFRQYMGYSSYLFKGIKVVLIFLVVIFWAFSVHFVIDLYVMEFIKYESPTSSNGLTLFYNYYNATLMLLLVNYERENFQNFIEYANVIFILCFGFALQLFVYSQILQVWTKYASAENKHHSLHKQFKEYMKYKELPVSLRERIFSYFQFKFHKQFFKESDINNMVSSLLKQEILLHVTRNHIERVEFFRHLPENILMKVVAQLKSEIFLPGDVIISAGTSGNSMFFIYHGTVAVYTPGGKEICHLEDGAHFGEIALILSETRVATVVAVTASELFMLRRSDFLAAIEPFPEFRDQLLAIATERLQKTILQSDN